MTPDLDTLVLKHGSHKKREEGLCLMEAVSYFAGLPHSDHPKCSSRVLTEFGIRLNDRMNETERQSLKPFIPRLVGTNDPEKEKMRAQILCWAAIAEMTPALLRFVKDERCEVFAERLEGLGRYDWANGKAICNEAHKVARKVRDERWAKLTAKQRAAAATRAKIFDLALSAFDRAIRCEEVEL